MSDTSGPTLPPPLARWDRDSSCWRTSPDTSLWDLPMSLGTLPRSGMTRAGSLYELPMPELPTVAPASSSLPTPMARDWKDTSIAAAAHRPDDEDTLSRALHHLLPTPTVVDMGAMRDRHGNGNGHGASLTQEALALLPTPSGPASGDMDNPRPRPTPRSSGAATPPPSSDGSGSPDPHPHLPFPAPTGDHDSRPDSSSG